MNAGDTIFALGTGPGRGAIALLRISGADSFAVVERLAGRVPAPRFAAVRALRNAAGEVLDRAIVLWLPGPGSYTGEDCAELHVHGGRAVVRAVSDALLAAGCRPAEPGEFSRRAFLLGKLDLLEAEGVADLVAAETEGQRRQALRLLEGAASGELTGWADRLRRVLAWQEALIDFPDDDLPVETGRAVETEITALKAAIATALDDAARGARVRDGIVVAVSGPPNVGKSSLVNALARRDVAIVAATAGTTRDALEVLLDIAGVPVTLVDTAGLRETDDPVEAEGVRRARARAAAADLVMEIADARCGERAAAPTDGRLCVANKVDLAPAPSGWLGVSAKTGCGMAALEAALGDAVRRLTHVSGSTVLSQARHRAALADAVQALQRAGEVAAEELRGEELRSAMRALGRITGAVGIEDILDTVFLAFCIGK
jgi:tRNA modification GTPase